VLVADTSALYALFDAGDAHHGKARAQLAAERPFLVPSEILSETIALLRLRLGRDASRQAVRSVLSFPHGRIAATKQATIDLAAAGFASGTGLTYEDWIVVHTCRAIGARPWSFDSDLIRSCR